MESSLYRDLAWLPRPNSKFGDLCRSILKDDDSPGRSIRALASGALDDNQLIKLAKTIGSARTMGKSLAPLAPYRLGLLTNSTTEFIGSALVATAARYGLALECVAAPYDQAIQESLSPDSMINKAALDGVLIALDWRGLPLHNGFGSDSGSELALDHLRTIGDGIKQNSGATCIFQTLAAPPETIFGSLDRVLPGVQRSTIDTLNRRLSEMVRSAGDILLDVAGCAETVGLANWHSPSQWNLAKLPFAQEFLPLYADYACRLIAALLGKSRRCLVLDLDNTLWGGVIGDDGLEGIRIAQGDAAGEAYLSFQRYLLSLRDRGVVLAVSSKNEDAIARMPFQKHPEMLLREEHFAVFQANWNDKPSNIQAIAAELSLGLDSFVFVDDNPFERELVRKSLPQVAVPEMSEDPALYARLLSAAGYFEAAALLPEDLQRAEYYAGNARRAALQQQVGDLDAYLESLEMEITFQPFDDLGRSRITQLINKSNQFNLTTKRYSEADVGALQFDTRCFTMQVRLVDRFGDNGMISVVICRETSSDTWEIDTWLMSCRVLGRRVENMVLREIQRHARERNIGRLIGTYIPTDRNKLVADHYEKLGFAMSSRREDGSSLWELDLFTASIPGAPMRSRSSGFETSISASAGNTN